MLKETFAGIVRYLGKEESLFFAHQHSPRLLTRAISWPHGTRMNEMALKALTCSFYTWRWRGEYDQPASVGPQYHPSCSLFL